MKARGFILIYVIILFLFPFPVSAEPDTEQAAEEDSFFTSLEAAGDWLIHLVIPRDGYFEDELNKLDEKFREKIPFDTYVTTIGRLKEVSGAFDGNAEILDVEYEYMGQTNKLNISGLIAPHLPLFRDIVTGLYMIFIAHYNYRQIMHLIRGTTYGRAFRDTGA
jgi:hypothetical protein